jgi:hypothetical protein
MIQLDDEALKKKDHLELWKVEIPLSNKDKPIKCRLNSDFFGFMIKDGPDEDLLIFIYDVVSSKYIGFINISKLLEVKGLVID